MWKVSLLLGRTARIGRCLKCLPTSGGKSKCARKCRAERHDMLVYRPRRDVNSTGRCWHVGHTWVWRRARSVRGACGFGIQ